MTLYKEIENSAKLNKLKIDLFFSKYILINLKIFNLLINIKSYNTFMILNQIFLYTLIYYYWIEKYYNLMLFKKRIVL